MSVRVDPRVIGEHLEGRDVAYVLSVRDGRVHVIAHRLRADGNVVSITTPGGSLADRLDGDPRVTVLWPPSRSVGEYGLYSLIADGDGRRCGEDVEITLTSAILHRPAP